MQGLAMCCCLFFSWGHRVTEGLQNDHDLAIDWPIKSPILSEKEAVYPLFSELWFFLGLKPTNPHLIFHNPIVVSLFETHCRIGIFYFLRVPKTSCLYSFNRFLFLQSLISFSGHFSLRWCFWLPIRSI